MEQRGSSTTPMPDPTPPPLPSDALLTLVAECLDAMEKEGVGAIERVCARHPLHAPAIRRRLKWLADAGLLPGGPEADPGLGAGG